MHGVIEAGPGKGRRLRLKTVSADKGSMVPVVRERPSLAGRRERESGQALVEFALILPLFLMIVVGLIQFGLAFNFWLDLQRVGNQGARWAAVDCGQSASTPGPDPCGADIKQTLHDMVISPGNDATADVCWVETNGNPGGTQPGDAVRVTLKTEYVFLGITGFLKDTSGLTMDINADATMRLEQAPTSPALAAVSACSP